MDNNKITSLSLTKECKDIIKNLEMEYCSYDNSNIYDVCLTNFADFQEIIKTCKELEKKLNI